MHMYESSVILYSINANEWLCVCLMMLYTYYCTTYISFSYLNFNNELIVMPMWLLLLLFVLLLLAWSSILKWGDYSMGTSLTLNSQLLHSILP